MNDDFFKDDRNFMSPAEVKSANVPKLINIIKIFLLIYGVGYFIFGAIFASGTLMIFLMSLGSSEESYLLSIVAIPFILGFECIFDAISAKKKRKSIWLRMLILSIMIIAASAFFISSIGILDFVASYLGGEVIFKSALCIPGVILLICLLTKQVRDYYFEDELKNRFFDLSSCLTIGLLLVPVLLVGFIYLKLYTTSHDKYLSYLIDKMGIESAVSEEGNGIIGQWYDTHNRLPESIDEFIFSAPNPETIEIDGITYAYFSLTSEEKERLNVFLKNKELTYQRNGEKSYTICGAFKTRRIFGEEDDLSNDTNPYYHERGLKCIQKSIEE